MKAGDRDVPDERLLADIESLRADVARRRLRIFRAFLARQVRIASPLLVDASGRPALDDAAWRLRPMLRWPRDLASQAIVHVPVGGGVRMVDGTPVVPRPRTDRLVLRVAGRSAHMVMRAGGMLIRTDDDGGTMRLPGFLGPFEARALVGSRVDEVFPHAITIDQPYTITHVAGDRRRSGTLLEFHASPIEWRPPWAAPWTAALRP